LLARGLLRGGAENAQRPPAHRAEDKRGHRDRRPPKKA